MFEYGGTQYIQKDGTAIGSKLGKNDACTYLGEWESQLLEKAKVKPYIYKRFVDDICGIWVGTLEDLHEFHSLANNIHSNIKVDLRTSTVSIEMLDTNLYVEESCLKADLYRKPTDKPQYLHKTSDHPNITKPSIPYSLRLRLKRICSKQKEYTLHRTDLKVQLEGRGYNSRFVESQLKKVDKIPRDKAPEIRKNYSVSEKAKRVVMAVTYSRNLPNIKQILTRRHCLLHKSDRLKQAFRSPPMVAYRRCKSLQDILVHYKLNKIQSVNRSDPCGKGGALCQLMIERTTFGRTGSKLYEIKGYIDCNRTDVMYCIECKKCNGLLYVGETMSLYERFQNHKSTIKKNGKSQLVDKHFNADMGIIGIQKLNRDSTFYRRNIEDIWIDKLNTYVPNGLYRQLNNRFQ